MQSIVSFRIHSHKFTSCLKEEEEDVPLDQTLSKTINNPSGLLDHLDALRKHIFRILIGIMLTSGFSFIYTPKIIDIMAAPVGGLENLTAIDVTEPISVFMRVALLSGITLAMPYIIFEFWLFIAPGLRVRTRLRSLVAIPVASFLFLGGMAFAYFVLLPVGIPWLVSFMGMPTDLRPYSYVQFVTTIIFWIGVCFEFPLIIYFLALIGLVKGKGLASQWRIAIVIIAVLAAAITPTIDPINMGLVMLPMSILYFISIGLAYLAEGSRSKST